MSLSNLEDVSKDISRINKVVNIDEFIQSEMNVHEYYTKTSFRDYLTLKLLYKHDVMHTILDFGNGNNKDPFTSLSYVISQLGENIKNKNKNNKKLNVLEIGYGKGDNSYYLASIFQNIDFYGIDLVKDHFDFVQSKKKLENLHFFHGDATCLEQHHGPLKDIKFDVIFGIESFCYFDNQDKRNRILAFCKSNLSKNGKLVIVDGFRHSNSHSFSQKPYILQQTMRLVETGFDISAMPSKRQWIENAHLHKINLVNCIDYTKEASRFWDKWGKIASFVLHYTPIIALKLVQKYLSKSFNNLISACMVRHTLNHHMANYGVLVFQLL